MAWFPSSMPFWAPCCRCWAWLNKTIWSGCSLLVSEHDDTRLKVSWVTMSLFSHWALGKKKTYLAKCFTFAHVMTPVLCLMLSPCVHITHLWIEVSLSSTEGTCAFSPYVTALSHFSESILEYLANLDKAPDPTVRKDTFSSEIYASYDILFCNWLQSREPKVRLTRKSTAPIKANPVCAQRLFFCTNRSHGMPAGRPLISLPAVSKISSH